MDRRTFLTGMAAAGAVMLSGTSHALIQSEANFSGRTLEFIIPFSEGGGTDVWGRFFAPYLSRHLPGNPNVVIRNVPGAGTIIGTNEFARRTHNDGRTILGTGGSTHFAYLLEDARVRYDYADFLPVLISPTGGVVYIPPELGVSNASEMGQLLGRELIYGSQGATSLDLVPLLAFRALGLDVRHVFGMSGRADGRLAFERGEATIDYQTTAAYQSSVEPMVSEGRAVPLFSWGVLDAKGNVQRDPSFPDLPHFVEAYEMMHGKAPSGIEFDAYMAFFAPGFAAQKIVLVHVGTEPKIAEAYRKAFVEAVADPELQAKKGDVLGEYTQAAGEDMEVLYRLATTIDPTARDWVKELLTTEYGVTF